jgi:cytidylate kinase
VQISDRIFQKKQLDHEFMQDAGMQPCGREQLITNKKSKATVQGFICQGRQCSTAVVSGSRFRVFHLSNRRAPRAEDVIKQNIMPGTN